MAYVITGLCTKDAACVDACPVDAIHPRTDEAEFDTVEQLFIDPDACIDCGACQSACPSEAIFGPGELPAEWAESEQKNAGYYQK
ncbi:MAG: 4Fe-4S binding protein [Dehalococcoidales bacterium]|nr:4Fe-4S binding protein [Dehalococcoidales bacterium]